MSKVMIIGAGGVGQVVTHKCAQLPEVFTDIVLASRTEAKCRAIAGQLERPIRTARVDADNVAELAALLRREQPELVINVALPYQDLAIMDACLEAGVHYMDTANYEPPDTARFEYRWQWAYRERFERAILDIEKHANNLDDVTKAAETIRSGADRILTRVRIDQEAFRRQIEELRRLLDALRDA